MSWHRFQELRWLVPGVAGLALVAPEALAAESTSAFDRIWSYAEWYKNASNPVIQSFRFTGRFHVDYATLDAKQGDHDEWNVRRLRLGAVAALFHDFTLHADVDINPQEAHPAYQRLTEVYLAWSRSGDLTIKLGKHSAPFTMDGSTSSKELLTIDRANLANNLWFPNEYFPGVSASGQPGRWRYHAGLYSSGAANKEFGEFTGGVFALGSLGCDFARELEVKQAVLAVNYVYNEPDVDNTFTRSLQHVASLNLNLDAGRWGARADVSAGAGYLGQSDLWGAMFMPFCRLTDKLMVVGRYTHVQSDGPNGVRLALYENQIVPGRGDVYDEFYLGLNWFLYGHKLKLQTGVQHATMKDRAADGGAHRGWSWVTGLRVAW